MKLWTNLHPSTFPLLRLWKILHKVQATLSHQISFFSLLSKYLPSTAYFRTCFHKLYSPAIVSSATWVHRRFKHDKQVSYQNWFLYIHGDCPTFHSPKAKYTNLTGLHVNCITSKGTSQFPTPLPTINSLQCSHRSFLYWMRSTWLQVETTFRH